MNSHPLSPDPGTLTWTARWIGPDTPATAAATERILAGLGLASLYGVAIGIRSGGLELLRNGLGVPAGLALAALVSVPSLFVLVAFLDVPLRAPQVFQSITRGIAAAGLVLAGLTPAVALFSLTVESLAAIRALVWCGFALAGSLGLLHTTRALKQRLGAEARGRPKLLFASVAFCVLISLLATRSWSALLPLLGGAP